MNLVSLEAELFVDQYTEKLDFALLKHFLNHHVNANISVWIHWFLRENTVFEPLLEIKLKLLSLLIIFARIRGGKILVLLHVAFNTD